MIRHNSRRAAFNRFPLARTGVVTVKLRTFGFLAVVLVGLLFSSCAAAPRRVAISGRAPAGAAELTITQNIIPPGKCGRPLHRPMRPTFITIHSTDNTSRSADALRHALAMNKGLRGRHNRTGFLTWHFTVDDHSIYQSLPTNETGEHADYEGQGNMSSIGIEMCVNRGNNLGSTIDRTAQLTARLMRQYDIPLDHVVPHMHWRMIRYSDGRDLGFKKCPRILLDGGRLGPKWDAFMAKVSFYAG
jgi:N-acetylmuramoyl-L-alanine amidase